MVGVVRPVGGRQKVNHLGESEETDKRFENEPGTPQKSAGLWKKPPRGPTLYWG